jgi:hypothetical protein
VSVSAADLARRVRTKAHVRIDERAARNYLEDWRERGIAQEIAPGRWALTLAGRAMFAGWANGIHPERDNDYEATA